MSEAARRQSGLSEAEAARRRASGDGNDVAPPGGDSYARIVRRNAFATVNIVLFGVSILLVLLGLPIDAAVTGLPVFLNVGVGVGLEASAKWRLDRLRILSAPRARVIRDGRERPIDTRELVRGDLVVLDRGDQIVLDGDLVEGDLDVDEALLTGESEPVRRVPGDRLLSGSACLAGHATMIVTRVGLESYANRITAEARGSRTERTPLQHDVDRLIAATAVLVVLASVPVLFVSGRSNTAEPTTELVRAAAVLAALVPQGLAIMITVTYAVGALRISRAGALVQRINAVESTSRVDLLVLDKTGTLTAGRVELRELLPIAVDGSTARRLLVLAARASPPGDRIGDAIGRGSSASEDDTAASSAPAIADRVPYSSGRRWSGVVVGGERPEAIVLGAPERLLQPDGAQASQAETVQHWADSGLRVLVVSRAAGSTLRDGAGEPLLPRGLVPVAIVAFAEELRSDASATLSAFAEGGVTLKVVSGDNPRTAAAVAGRAGLAGIGEPLAGPDLEPLDEAGLGGRVDGAAVIGRVVPALKARIVRALRRQGHYVAMIGDGVNDIPALKAAQLGIVMESGSGASRAVADLVLVRDRFAVLPSAVAEGRRIVAGMVSVACLLLARTFALLLIVVGAAIAGLDFPITPRNNALLALVTVGVPSLVLAAWARPVPPPASLIRRTLRFALPAALAVAAVALPVYARYLDTSGSLDVARAALTSITVYCGILLIPFLVPPTRRLAALDDAGRKGDWRPTALAAAMVLLYGLIGALPIARSFFELEPVPITDELALALLAVVWSVGLYLARGLGLVDRLLRAAGTIRRRSIASGDGPPP